MVTTDALAVQAAYAAATRAGDVEALAELTDPDAVVWHNFDQVELTASDAARSLQWLHRTFDDLRWTDVAVLPTPEGFVWQAVITGAADGGTLEAHTCMVVTVSPGGRVRRVAEYLDPAAFAAAAS